MKVSGKNFTQLYSIFLFILKIHLLSLLLFTIIRSIFLFFTFTDTGENETGEFIKSFFIGIHFDNLIVSCAGIIPIVFSIFSLFFDYIGKNFTRIFSIYYIVIYAVFFGFAISDIPYFSYFYKHLDISVAGWMKYGSETFGMILDESGYYKFYIIYLLILIAFSFLVVRFGKRAESSINNRWKCTNKWKFITTAIILATLAGYGFSTRYGLNVLNAKTAYHCGNNYANEICHNAVYYFFRSIFGTSYKDPDFSHVISDDDAFELIKRDFKESGYCDISPVCRIVKSDNSELQANVVIVLMETMASYYVEETPHLTPTLNDIKSKSYYFKNTFTPGTHTNQGIFSTLFGIPAMFDKIITDNRGLNYNNLVNSHLPECEGFPYILNEKGYNSLFFLAHWIGFDNMDIFLPKNGYKPENIFSKKDFDESEYVNAWGVSDKSLFSLAIKKFSEQTSPFFGTIMTMTNHPEYVVPEEFKHISKDLSEQAVFFSDYCIKVFLEESAKEEWFDNTIFVLVGDHGKYFGFETYDMPLAYNHVPLFIFSPLFEPHGTIEDIASQIDIFPTVMGLMNIDYKNNSLGIDLLKQKRRYAVFTTDDKIGCIDNKFMYNYSTFTQKEAFYEYKESPKDILGAHSAATDSMRKYAAATVQVTNNLLNNRLTKRKE